MRDSLQNLALWVSLALLVGGVGSAAIMRARLPFIRTAAWFLLLAAVPYAGALIAIAVSLDPSLSAQKAQYNGGMAFALFVIGFTVPWLVVCVIGGLIGARLRRATVATAAPPEPRSGAVSDLPDWRHADSPMLTLPELYARIVQIADRHGFSRDRLPECGSPRDGEGGFVDRDKFDYLYGYCEPGRLTTTYAAAVCDELCYRVFYDLAYGDAMRLREQAPRAGVADLVQIREALYRILSQIDPRWAAQARSERTGPETSTP